MSASIGHCKRSLRNKRNDQRNRRHTLSSTNTFPFLPVPPALPFRPLIFCAGCIWDCAGMATWDSGPGDCEGEELIWLVWFWASSEKRIVWSGANFQNNEIWSHETGEEFKSEIEIIVCRLKWLCPACRVMQSWLDEMIWWVNRWSFVVVFFLYLKQNVNGGWRSKKFSC